MFLTDFITNVYANFFGAWTVIMPDLLASAMNTNNVSDAGLAKLGAGLSSIGFLGAGIGQGNAGAGACMAIGRNPEVASKITTTMIISSGIAESGAIYALIVAILLLFVV